MNLLSCRSRGYLAALLGAAGGGMIGALTGVAALALVAEVLGNLGAGVDARLALQLRVDQIDHFAAAGLALAAWGAGVTAGALLGCWLALRSGGYAGALVTACLFGLIVVMGLFLNGVSHHQVFAGWPFPILLLAGPLVARSFAGMRTAGT